MSHFTRIRTKLRNPEYLRQAIGAMGFTEISQSGVVLGHGGQKEKADIIARVGAGQVGFRKKGDSYEIVADWWIVGRDGEDFTSELTRTYAQQAVIAESKKQGFQIQKTEKLKDGSMRIVVERWV
ncbi:MAG TPA: DUF1257 domain-containing protein [Candidatus Brocadiia bacterium]|nr:DUF1257 domain-containing protein [Candidatus Brocadiia bacterium]